MKAKVFEYPMQILEKDLDFYGHVNNATYLVFYEQARWDIITGNGYSAQVIRETGIGPVILEIHIKYLKELRLRDHVTIRSEMISYEKKIGKMLQTILRGEEVCSTAEIIFSLFDLKERKLIMPTPEWFHAIGIDPNET